jgi:hypothetical protein
MNSPSGPPVYPQDQVVKLVPPFEFRIEKCYWADEIEKPGLRNLPPAFQEKQRAAFISKPKHRFLVVELSEKNTANSPMHWKPLTAPLFGLKNAKGASYNAVDGSVNMEGMTQAVAGNGEGAVVNPDDYIRGKEIFDVPQDDYLLSFATGAYNGAGLFEANRVLCKWSLAPTGKQ